MIRLLSAALIAFFSMTALILNAFNVGVEAGQLIALVAMLLVLAAWRKRPSFTHFIS